MSTRGVIGFAACALSAVVHFAIRQNEIAAMFIAAMWLIFALSPSEDTPND